MTDTLFTPRDLTKDVELHPLMVDEVAKPRIVRFHGGSGVSLRGFVYNREPYVMSFVDRELGSDLVGVTDVGENYAAVFGVNTRWTPLGLGYVFQERFGVNNTGPIFDPHDDSRRMGQRINGSTGAMADLAADVIAHPEAYQVREERSP